MSWLLISVPNENVPPVFRKGDGFWNVPVKEYGKVFDPLNVPKVITTSIKPVCEALFNVADCSAQLPSSLACAAFWGGSPGSLDLQLNRVTAATKNASDKILDTIFIII